LLTYKHRLSSVSEAIVPNAKYEKTHGDKQVNVGVSVSKLHAFVFRH